MRHPTHTVTRTIVAVEPGTPEERAEALAEIDAHNATRATAAEKRRAEIAARLDGVTDGDHLMPASVRALLGRASA